MFGWFVRLVSRLFFFTGYVGLNSSFPDPLPAEEERRCLEAMAQGDELAREKLIEHNLRLVAHIAKKYASPKRDSDDLISIGTVGLIKAVSTFNTSKSKTLAAYAARCIENEILMSLRAEKKQNGEVYLMEPIGTDNDGNEISLCDILGTDADHVHNEAERSMEAERLWQAIDDVLSARERTVVKLRYGIPCGRCMAQREVAAILGISRSYVSRLEKKALTKLYSRLGEKSSMLSMR